jgi:hypothetical protein
LQAEEAKKQGNECMKADKFFEAVLHYTKAIKIESDNPPFYSNRQVLPVLLSDSIFNFPSIPS